MKLVAFVALLSGCQLAAAAETAVPVRTALVQRQAIGEQLPLTGNMTTRRFANLSPQVDAWVKEVLVEAGDVVEQGAILIQLDDVMARYEVRRSAAALEEARAQLQESERKRDELGKLIKNQYLARSSYDTSVSQVHINQAVVKRLQAVYERNKELAARHVLKAPYAGVIGKKRVESGQWVKVGDTVLELVDIEHLRLEVQVPQRYFLQLQPQTPVWIYPDALLEQPIKATVSRKIPVADAAAHTFPVFIAIHNRQRRYMPGMSAKAVFELDGARNNPPVLLVPRDAVIKRSGRPDSVWVLKSEQGQWRAYPVNIETGRAGNENVEVVSGELRRGDQVVIRGNETLKPGQLVRVIP